MRTRMALAASVIAACSLAVPAQAAPPEGNGPGNYTSNPGKGGNGGRGNPHASGNPGQGNSGRGKAGAGNAGNGGPDMRGRRDNGPRANGGANSGRNYDSRRRYDDKGRHYRYFDDHRDRYGHLRGGNSSGGLVYAGITAAVARDYALDFGLGGYSTLPPGIRKNLARGKPIPPGIAKKMVPGSLLARLPSYPGYEWRVAGTDLILVAVATAVVADILYDVFD